MERRTDPGKFRWCQALSRSRSLATTLSHYFLAVIVLCVASKIEANNPPPGQQDAIHITAILGESVVFNCHVEFPGDHPVPYVLQWEKKLSETGQEVPIYIWYENYPTHSGEGYEGRVSRVSPDSPFGAASLNLTNIRELDQGWYECKVVFLNRSPNQHKNGSWFHLDVHAPPRFSVTPDEVVYINLGGSIILNCQADGTPTPEILWYKDGNPVDPSSTVGVFNDGTELRISTIRHEEIGDYTCIARNGEGQVSHTARVIIAGGAVIMVPPTNQTKLEGEKAIFTCEAKAMPGNVTVRWFREGSPVREVASLETRVTIRKDGSLIINPVSADDSGQYLCEVSNGIGDPQSASAYLNVEYPAKVTFTPTVQYLPFRLAGVVQCYIKSNPPLQYVTWTKDKRLLEPYQTKEIVIMNNGSLLFTRVNQSHQGRYTCTPYNAQGTQGSSGPMEVLVRKPPIFTIEPDLLYQRKVGESVEMHCDAQEAEGTQRPSIQWFRRDGIPLHKGRVKMNGGNLTIEQLIRSDFGFYQCVVSNEVATISASTQLIIEGTQPHAPHNLTGLANENSITISWSPGYSGGPDFKQEYTVWYREIGSTEWQKRAVTPPGSTQYTITDLSPGKTYEFQMSGKNALGDGMMSTVATIRTLETAKSVEPKGPIPTTAASEHAFKNSPADAGPRPSQPRNVNVTEKANGFLIEWQPPLERTELIQHYSIAYRTDSHWKTLNRERIRPEETSYLVKNLVGGRTYYFRIKAHSLTSFEASDEFKYSVPASVKHKAIMAGVVGGILFFIVAIILSICAVKICNERKRRKQEKAYNMVACRLTDARTAANCQQQNAFSSNHVHVPSKNYRKTQTSRSKSFWRSIWLSDQDSDCQTIYSITGSNDLLNMNLDHIHQSLDRRFVSLDRLQMSNRESKKVKESCDISEGGSDSDDGGFLAHRNRQTIMGCCRPVFLYTNNHHAASSTATHEPLHYVNHRHPRVIQRQQHLLQTVPIVAEDLWPTYQNVNNLRRTKLPSASLPSQTPSRVIRFVSSSPAFPTLANSTVRSPHSTFFSDLSSVQQPSSIDRTIRSPPTSHLYYLREQYAQALPSLSAIHEEKQRRAQGFVPLQIELYSPSLRQYHEYRKQSHLPIVHRSVTQKLFTPRHAKSNVHEIVSPMDQLSIIEISPESQTSSSGFGSKNTSTQPNNLQFYQTSDWRQLPPYRSPPRYRKSIGNRSDSTDSSASYTMEHWLDLVNRLNSDVGHSPKAIDVGSVDGHYEFDPSTPTPSASTPTGARDDLFTDASNQHQFTTTALIQTHSLQPYQRKRVSKYDNIEARVQAMKDEFHSYQKRQTLRNSDNLELQQA